MYTCECVCGNALGHVCLSVCPVHALTLTALTEKLCFGRQVEYLGRIIPSEYLGHWVKIEVTG